MLRYGLPGILNLGDTVSRQAASEADEDGMPTIQVEISDAQAASLAKLAKLCCEADAERDNATTHGELTPDTLVAMLIEDATLVIDRPGSWEAEKMMHLLDGHGYEL